MKRALLAATLLLPTLSVFSLGQDDISPSEPQSRFSEHIVWGSNPPDRTRFIPVSRLQEAKRSSLPAHPDEIARIEELVRHSRATRSQGEDSYCSSFSDGGSSRKPASYARSLVEHLHFMPLTGYGTVTEVVLGLSLGRVATLVYVEVEEIWHCPQPAANRTVAVGDVVAVLQQKGRIEVDGEILCNATDEILGTPEVGTKVVFGGGTFEGDPYYIGRGLLLPVVDGQILPQPYKALSERVLQPFEEVRGQMDAGLQICEGPDENE
jgi:hypothetical protein